jgi:hypothetical protein
VNPRQADRITTANQGKLAANPAGGAARTDRVTSQPSEQLQIDFFTIAPLAT